MDGSSEDVLLRMRENAGAFEAQSDRRDDNVHDGKHCARAAMFVHTARRLVPVPSHRCMTNL
jgi:hypothetical protein